MKYFSVVPKEVVQFYKGDFGIRPIGTGPFQLKVWKDKASLVLEKIHIILNLTRKEFGFLTLILLLFHL